MLWVILGQARMLIAIPPARRPTFHRPVLKQKTTPSSWTSRQCYPTDRTEQRYRIGATPAPDREFALPREKSLFRNPQSAALSIKRNPPLNVQAQTCFLFISVVLPTRHAHHLRTLVGAFHLMIPAPWVSGISFFTAV